ncbi:response regulator [Streptosporangium sp. NPDC050855]|uniref:response regulator transcription factor n=1 Tax=Streptosporangium sp. NPDC050855 TaxID=3366194 RepID=UPI00379FB62A
MDVIRVLVADDEPVVRRQIRDILSSTPDIAVTAETSTGPGTVAAVSAREPDVVLMDIRMPGGDGLSAAERIREDLPEQVIVILTTFGEDAYVDRALRLGVNGFLLKSGDPYELINGIRAAAAGGACLSPHVAARLIRRLPRPAGPRPPGHGALAGLTPGERRILVSLARGRSNAEIAAEHFLTEGTVKGYVSAIFVRLGVRNRVEAAILAHESGLLR